VLGVKVYVLVVVIDAVFAICAVFGLIFRLLYIAETLTAVLCTDLTLFHLSAAVYR